VQYLKIHRKQTGSDLEKIFQFLKTLELLLLFMLRGG